MSMGLLAILGQGGIKNDLFGQGMAIEHRRQGAESGQPVLGRRGLARRRERGPDLAMKRGSRTASLLPKPERDLTIDAPSIFFPRAPFPTRGDFVRQIITAAIVAA